MTTRKAYSPVFKREFARNAGTPRIALVGAPETRPGELERLLASFALRRLAPLDVLQARLLAFHRRAPVDRNPRNLHELPRHAPPDDHDCLCAGPLTLDRTETNILDVQVYNLRRKLRAHGVRGLIETVRGVGYRLVIPASPRAGRVKQGASSR